MAHKHRIDVEFLGQRYLICSGALGGVCARARRLGDERTEQDSDHKNVTARLGAMCQLLETVIPEARSEGR